MNLKQAPCGFCAIYAVYLLKIGQWLHSWSPEPAQLPARLCPLSSLTALPSWPRVASCSGLIAHKTWHCTGMHLKPIHGNLLLSTFTNHYHLQSTKCFLYFKTYTFFSIKLIQFQKDKEEKKHFSSSSLVFTWNFNLFVLWAKEINKKHDIYVHSSKREVAGSSIVYRDFGKWLSRRVNYTIHFIR